VGGESNGSPETYQPLVRDGPVAYQSQLPLGSWANMLCSAGIPATVSYHAGTFLCNATLYLTHYLAERKQLRTRSTFVHLPLDTIQTAREKKEIPALPATLCAKALQMIVAELVKYEQPRDLERA
jgi:pyroglutamyl-peptidase